MSAPPSGIAVGTNEVSARLIDEGNILEDEGRLAEALQRYDEAIRLAPKIARGHLNRGNALSSMGNIKEGIKAFDTAIKLDPNYASAYYNMGNAQAGLSNHEVALTAYRKALQLKPDFAQVCVAMGCVMEDLGKFEEAVSCYQQATELRPDYPEAYYNIGLVSGKMGKIDAAITNYGRAVEIKPDYTEAHFSLAVILRDNYRQNEAITSYRHALTCDPDRQMAFSNLLFSLTHDEEIDPNTLFSEHLAFGRHVETSLKENWPKHTNLRDPDRCLRIGFVSGDFYAHAVALFVEPMLAVLAKSSQLSLYAYYNNPIEDHITSKIKTLFRYWRTVNGLSDTEFVEQIRRDEIDILVDLSGHTGLHRLHGFARKPAPIQASWIGYPATTGLKSMDYYIADSHWLPPGKLDDQFTEKLVYLPANAPFQPPKESPDLNELPALRNGCLTFGSFNRPNKLSPTVIALWSKLLKSLPNSRMLLGGLSSSLDHEVLIDWFEREGVSRERLFLYPRSELKTYLALHHQVDICLDTFPYSGGTTSSLALWMGVPTLTLAGRTAPSRQGAAMLGYLGLDQFVAENHDEFVSKGLYWSAHLADLAHLRHGMRARFERAPSGQPEVIVAALEQAFRMMWRNWCDGKQASSIDVSRSSDLSNQSWRVLAPN